MSTAITFLVKFSDGRCVSVTMNPDAPIHSLKPAIAEAAGIDVETITSVTLRGGKRLDGDMFEMEGTISQSGVSMECVLKVEVAQLPLEVTVSAPTTRSGKTAKTFRIELSEEDTLGDLRAKIEDATGVPAASQVLTIRGRRLPDEKGTTITQAEICRGDQIDVAAEVKQRKPQQQPKPIAVLVKLPSGRAITVTANLSLTVEALKTNVRRAARGELGPDAEFILRFDGRDLDPSETLAACGIENESVLAAVVDRSNEVFMTPADTFWRAVGRFLAAVFAPVYNVVATVLRLVARPLRAILRPIFDFLWRIWRGICRLADFVDRWLLAPSGRAASRAFRRVWIASSNAAQSIGRRAIAPAARWVGRRVDSAWNFVVVPSWDFFCDYALFPVGRGIRYVAKATGRGIRAVSRFTYDHLMTPVGHAIRAVWRGTSRAVNRFCHFFYDHVLSPIGRGFRAVWRAWRDRIWRPIIRWLHSRPPRPSTSAGPGTVVRALNAAGRALKRWAEAAARFLWRVVRFVMRNTVLRVLRAIRWILVRLGRHVLGPAWRNAARPVLERTLRLVGRCLRFVLRILGVYRLARWLAWRGHSVGFYAVDIQPHVRFVGAAVGETPLFVLRDRQTYAVKLWNNSWVQTRCNLSIDGRPICSLLMSPHSSYLIERPLESVGRFTFRISEAARAAAAGAPDGTIVTDPEHRDNGLVTAQFIPRRTGYYGRRVGAAAGSSLRRRTAKSSFAEDEDGCGSGSSMDAPEAAPAPAPAPAPGAAAGTLVAGRTELQGESTQAFTLIRGFDGDMARAITITVRLVGSN